MAPQIRRDMMKCKIALLGLIFSLASYADFKEMSERLVRVRQEIEILNTDLESLQKNQNSQLDSLLSRRSELEIQLKKERLKSLQLKEKKMALKNKIAPKKGLSLKERAMVLRWHKDLTQWLNNSLPYKIEERNLELKKIEEAIKNNTSFHEVVGQLWKFSEKQIDLIRHNKFEVLNLEVDGKKSTAEVARVGLLTFAFKLPSDEVGFAKKTGGKWILDVSDKNNELTAANRLISKFKEKKYSGLFELPIADL
jgi:chromosome condensin MukBEF ATPase and DNA-binding subunit MukB